MADLLYKIIKGDCLESLKKMIDKSINCIVTSPPYWNLRDYKVDGQLGLEKTPEEYIAKLVAVFSECKRVLKSDGTLWVNIGDSYAANSKNRTEKKASSKTGLQGGIATKMDIKRQANKIVSGLKPKDLVGIPWMLAFALRANGWYLRDEIIWAKPNPMPGSQQDRCTRSHETIFMLSKQKNYYYDIDAIKEEGTGVSGGASFGKVELDGPGARRISEEDNSRIRGLDKQRGHSRQHAGFNDRWDKMTVAEQTIGKVTKRNVWSVCPANYTEAHFATFPPKLIEPCILAGCPEGGTVLDPFTGSGTTGEVSIRFGRRFIGMELNPDYVLLAENRCKEAVERYEGMFAGIA